MKLLRQIFLLLTVLISMQVQAQSSIQAFDATIQYDDAQRPCIQVNIDPEPKTLKHAWKDYLKDHYDFRLKGIGLFSNKDILYAEEINVDQISSNQMDFYTSIIEDKNGSEMKIFVRYGYDIYLSKEKNPNDHAALMEILNNFLKYYLPKYYNGKVNDTEERINELVKETKDLEEEIADDKQTISEMKIEIEEMEKALEEKNELLEITNIKLNTRKEKLNRMNTRLQNL